MALVTEEQRHLGRASTSKIQANWLVQTPYTGFLFHCYSRATTRRYVEPGQDDLADAVERIAGGEE